ncbi:MAG: hypothetical protein EZS26_001351 [Candidatus Ordinivivax streblomastigis]|uniref:Lipocalin-like domain-containing protein n=1 Tax=Candidatus Ordinivivax streblomastigis TaxID=2540710 RepID=A0A5M8P241_9BACT|nr:MAG: hypothetical protein EZS26_001351 [Candidatus Ordinivivax streblomastigis]
MKKVLFPLVIVCALCASCVDSDLPNVNGMWQLKTIEEAGGSSHPVDTIYYSFQRQTLFAYTILNYWPERPDPILLVYGLIDLSVADRLTIHIPNDWKKDVLWQDSIITYTIRQLNAKKMVLEQEDVKYHFIKF